MTQTILQIAPYLMACTGAYLLLFATMIKAAGYLNGFIFRIVPSLLGALALWVSAAMLMAGAA